MPMMPKRVKYRKPQRGRMKGLATRGTSVSFGEYGLMALESAWVTARQIEAGRVAATRMIGNEGRLYLRIFPHKAITKKPLETRMGKGKAEPEQYVAVVRPGKVMFEIAGVTEDLARQALNAVAHKLSVRTKFVARSRVIG
jgi:large subunit ribosomal protein L16